MTYAHIQENMVVEICNPVPGFTIEQSFHIDLVDKMVACGDDVQVGWHYEASTGRFSETGEFSESADDLYTPLVETPVVEEPTPETPPTE